MAVLPLYNVGSGTEDTDFIGFSFNGKKSKDLGIKRVSDGSRYNEDLFGAFQDTTVQVPGGDGLYYFRTNFTQRTFNINVAFDKIKESQFIELRRAFAPQTTGPLIFDERPYKAYSVKVQAPPQFKYLCFEENGERVYKGEGTIVFVSYYPYASSVAKYLSDSKFSNYTNISQWSTSCRMLETQGVYDATNTATITVYNAGDVEADCNIYIALPSLTSEINAARNITLRNAGGTSLKTISLGSFTKKSASESYIRINSKTNLIEGCNSNFKPTGNLYNQIITSGDFFKIPICNSASSSFKIHTDVSVIASVSYNYLYY